jgi:hypothetical protein
MLSLSKHLYRTIERHCNGAVEMLRQAQHDDRNLSYAFSELPFTRLAPNNRCSTAAKTKPAKNTPLSHKLLYTNVPRLTKVNSSATAGTTG